MQRAPCRKRRQHLKGSAPHLPAVSTPNQTPTVVSWGKEEFGDEDDASFVVLAWPLRVTTCQRFALLGGRCSHGQALPALVARGHRGDSVQLRDGLHRTCPCLDQVLAVPQHLLWRRRSPVLGAIAALAPVVEHIASAPQWLQQRRPQSWRTPCQYGNRSSTCAIKLLDGSEQAASFQEEATSFFCRFDSCVKRSLHVCLRHLCRWCRYSVPHKLWAIQLQLPFSTRVQ